SSQALALVVSLLCFLIVAGFLLFLVPEPRSRSAAAANLVTSEGFALDAAPQATADAVHQPVPAAAQRPLPLGGLGQPPAPLASRLPVEGADGTHFLDTAEVRSIRADAHYTLVHDGSRERMCTWSISQAETQLDPAIFIRVHRSHIVAIPHVAMIRKEGDG